MANEPDVNVTEELDPAVVVGDAADPFTSLPQELNDSLAQATEDTPAPAAQPDDEAVAAQDAAEAADAPSVPAVSEAAVESAAGAVAAQQADEPTAETGTEAAVMDTISLGDKAEDAAAPEEKASVPAETTAEEALSTVPVEGEETQSQSGKVTPQNAARCRCVIS